MLVENISPFVRFATRQVIFARKNIVNYDHRLYFALNGSATITLNNKPYHMTPNSILLWHAGTTYSYKKDDTSTTFEIASCNFDYTRCAENVTVPVPPTVSKNFSEDKILSEHVNFTDYSKLNSEIFILNADILREPLLQLCREYQSTTTFHRLKLNAIFLEILYQLFRLVDFQTSNSLLAERVVVYLQNHFTESPTLETIGNIFSYHPNYLNNTVIQRTGFSIHQHILKLKLNRALELLMTTDLSIAEISSNIGISDPHYFSRIFKKIYGTPPHRFRQDMGSY